MARGVQLVFLELYFIMLPLELDIIYNIFSQFAYCYYFMLCHKESDEV